MPAPDGLTVDIQGGGIRRIAVTDDGCGIHPEDLLPAVERYATSKLSPNAGLDAISSLGFRGEALAAIRAASRRLRVTTRPQGADGAAAILCEQGAPPKLGAASLAPGTRVEVEELFEHLPARKAYLRFPQEEASRCLAVVQAYALLWPQVAFVARRDGKVVFSTSGSGDLRSAVAAVWGPQLAGELLAVAAASGAGPCGRRRWRPCWRRHVTPSSPWSCGDDGPRGCSPSPSPRAGGPQRASSQAGGAAQGPPAGKGGHLPGRPPCPGRDRGSLASRLAAATQQGQATAGTGCCPTRAAPPGYCPRRCLFVPIFPHR